MKKFILFLMLPLLMVMSGFAAEYEIEGENGDYYFAIETDYEKEDISIAVEDLGLDDDGDFVFNLYFVNDSKNKLIIDWSESGFGILDEDFEVMEESFGLFSNEDDADLIKARSEFCLPELILLSEDSLAEVDGVATSYYIEMEIKGETYYWAIAGIVAD